MKKLDETRDEDKEALLKKMDKIDENCGKRDENRKQDKGEIIEKIDEMI